MRRLRDVQSLRAAMEEATPPAPHLAHTVMEAVRAAAAAPAPRGLVRRRYVQLASPVAVAAAVLVALVVVTIGRVGPIVPNHAGNAIPPLASPGLSTSVGPGYDFTEGADLRLGAAVSPGEAWIVQTHDPGYYSSHPGPKFGIVYHTTDGGATWSRKLRFDGQYDWMRFSADGRVGVIWGVSQQAGLVYRTSDGGDHWAALHTPSDLEWYAMTFLDPDHGWALLHSPGGTRLTAYATSDGGQSWQARGTLGAPANVVIPSAWATSSRPLQFTDLSHGVFDPVPAGLGSWPSLLVTSDGGRSWRRVDATKPMSLDRFGDVFGGAPALFANGSGAMVVTNRAGSLYLYSTSDHGMTWSGPRQVTVGGAQPGDKAWLPYFTDPNHWWVSTQLPSPDANWLFITADGGNHWSQASRPPSLSVIDLVMASPTDGWVDYEYYSSAVIRLARTTDGGNHWAGVVLPPVEYS